MKESRLILAAAATLLLVACAKKDAAPTDTAKPASAGPTPVALADFAGKWQMRSVPETGDTTPTTYVLTASSDTTWEIAFTSGLKVPVHVTASGDSIILKTGVYTSQRRKGVKVMTEGSSRMQGGKIVGTTTAHYQGVKDSVLHLRVEGTKVP
jgi:hypothetical protein